MTAYTFPIIYGSVREVQNGCCEHLNGQSHMHVFRIEAGFIVDIIFPLRVMQKYMEKDMERH